MHITNMSRSFLLAVGLLSVMPTAYAIFAFNNIKPYDTYLWPNTHRDGQWQFQVYGAATYNERAVRWGHENKYNVLQMYSCDQNALAMIRGFDASTEIGQLAAQLSGVYDDGVRGHMVPQAFLHQRECGLGVQYWLPYDFCIGAYVPIRLLSLHDVSWRDCTQDITEGDLLTKRLLTDHFGQTVCQLGGPNVMCGWKKQGVGDIDLLVKWDKTFPQAKQVLSDVRLMTYLGVSLPTGARTHINELFSMPLGYDGATGLLFGGELGLVWKHHFIGGVQLDLNQLFGNTRTRRIKTDCQQTELIMLAKTPVYINWGFLQRYRLYLGTKNIMRGLSFDVTYQYQKQGDSELSICSNDYITSIAASAQTLSPWTLHQFIVNASYNFAYDVTEERKLAPSINFFYQHAFRGHRSILSNTCGCAVILAF